MDSIYLPSPNQPMVNVHPLVIFSLLNHHARREAGTRVIGALLGSVDKSSGVVEVTDAFGVYHILKEDEVSVRKQTLQDLYELHRKVNPKEVLIGWYSTWMGGRSGAAAQSQHLHQPPAAAAEHRVDDEFTVVVHEFFSDVAGPAMRPQGLIHLLVDVSLVTPHINVFAYRPISNALLKQVSMVNFARLRVNMVASSEERVGLDAMARAAHLRESSSSAGGGGGGGATAAGSAASDFAGEMCDLDPDMSALEISLRRLRVLLERVARYCEEVASGERVGDEAVGRAITDTLAAVPPFDADSFQRTFGRSVQDLLMVAYLATVAQAQVKLAEKIAQLPTGAEMEGRGR